MALISEKPDATTLMASVSQLLVLSGQLMMAYGAEISRIEETMCRMGQACGIPSVHVLCTPTSIVFSLVDGDEVHTRAVSRVHRGIDLAGVAAVNEISRQLEDGVIHQGEAMERLRQVESSAPQYPKTLSFLANGLSSACWALLLGGGGGDFLPAMAAGFLVHLVRDRMCRHQPDFIGIFFGALLGTMWAVAAKHLGLAPHQFAIVVGVIVPLVPGMALTNAVRNMLAGDLVSGNSLAAEALLVAVAIAAGVSSALAAMRAVLPA